MKKFSLDCPLDCRVYSRQEADKALEDLMTYGTGILCDGRHVPLADFYRRRGMLKYIGLFIVIQLISLVLTLVGLPLVAFAALTGRYKQELSSLTDWHFIDRWMWLWDNEEDGVASYWRPRPTAKDVFVWSALRNPVANLRHVKYVSGYGRPLFYRVFTLFGKEFYAKFGWMSDSFPACSVGAGRGY